MLEKCIKEARKLPYSHGKYRLYSIVVDNRGKVVGESANDYQKSHPMQKKYSLKAGECEHRTFLHAELSALLKAKEKARNGKVYVARIDRNGKAVNAQPCKSCQIAMRDFGIKSVEYTI